MCLAPFYLSSGDQWFLFLFTSCSQDSILGPSYLHIASCKRHSKQYISFHWYVEVKYCEKLQNSSKCKSEAQSLPVGYQSREL